MLGGVTVYLAGGGGSLDLCCYVLCGLSHHMCVSARSPLQLRQSYLHLYSSGYCFGASLR